jgi:hypothetical protein
MTWWGYALLSAACWGLQCRFSHVLRPPESPSLALDNSTLLGAKPKGCPTKGHLCPDFAGEMARRRV